MAQPMSSMAHTKHSSPTYQSAPMTHTSSVSYQFGSTTHPSSAYQPGLTTHPSPAYQPGPTTHPSRAYEPSHTTHPSPAYQPTPTTHPSPSYQSAPNLASVEKSRSRSRKKCFWEESETQLLIEVLQDMACDPSWKTDTGFRSNYLCEVHRRILVKRPSFSKKVSPHIESKVKWLKTKFHAISDMLKQSGCSWNDIDKKIVCEKEWYLSYCKNHKDAQGLWDFEFPYFNQLEVVYGKDRATGLVAEGYEDAIHNLEVQQNVENGGENLGEAQFTLSDEENDVHYMSHASQTASNLNNATKMANKQKTSTIGGKAA